MAIYRLTSDGSVQIHAWRDEDGHWSASFDEHPEFAFGADSAVLAAKRLVRSAEDLDESTLRTVYRSEDGRLAALTVRRSGGGGCPECGGTGRYIGLAVVEECRACGGSGRS